MTKNIDLPSKTPSFHGSDIAKKRLNQRYRSEARFKYIGLGAVFIACFFLFLLLYTIVSKAIPAFTYHNMMMPLNIGQSLVSSDGAYDQDKLNAFNYDGYLRQQMRALFPYAKSRKEKRRVSRLLSTGAGIVMRQKVLDNSSLLQEKALALPLDDFADLYFKDMVVRSKALNVNGIASPTGLSGSIKILSTSNDFSPLLREVKNSITEQSAKLLNEAQGLERSLAKGEDDLKMLEERDQPAKGIEDLLSRQRTDNNRLRSKINLLKNQALKLQLQAQEADGEEELGSLLPSLLISINGGVVKATSISSSSIEGDVLIPLKSLEDAMPNEWSLREIITPESNRKIDDATIVLLDDLQKRGFVKREFNWLFFSAGASREAEMAGVWGALIGSLLTMAVTLMISFPLGVSAAIYLEEFAPKNRWTNLIEVNINNLAAVPSIVFGLLGLAVFLNWFGMPRSAPVVGGIVLALMTLPTIIIASRAAIRAVPPSIREAALGIGASKLQTVFHHVLPLAMPGILTGTIIGMAQALGETAPLLMIGMVAFIVDIPQGFLDPATVLPVQIFMWADFPEPAFQQKTSAAILVLLSFLVAMNAIAVFLRKRFERRW